MMKKMLKTM